VRSPVLLQVPQTNKKNNKGGWERTKRPGCLCGRAGAKHRRKSPRPQGNSGPGVEQAANRETMRCVALHRTKVQSRALCGIHTLPIAIFLSLTVSYTSAPIPAAALRTHPPFPMSLFPTVARAESHAAALFLFRPPVRRARMRVITTPLAVQGCWLEGWLRLGRPAKIANSCFFFLPPYRTPTLIRFLFFFLFLREFNRGERWDEDVPRSFGCASDRGTVTREVMVIEDWGWRMAGLSLALGVA